MAYFRHHPSPGNDICFHLGPFLLLVQRNRVNKPVEMIIPAIIQLSERLKTVIEVGGEGGRIVVSQRGVVPPVLVLVIVGKTGYFLMQYEPFNTTHHLSG